MEDKIYIIETSRDIKEYNKEIRKFKNRNLGTNCIECGKELNILYDFDVDHDIPIAIGGKFYGENLQALCKLCHKHKTRFDNKFIKFLQSTYILTTFGGFSETKTNPEVLINFYLKLKELTKGVYDLDKNGTKRIEIDNNKK